MIKSRVEKLEKSIPTDDDPFRDLTNAELDKLTRKLELGVYNQMKDKDMAREYKELFIDTPTLFEIMWQTDRTHDEVMALFEKQRDWELEHEKDPEIKDEISDRYERMIKTYKFLRP